MDATGDGLEPMGNEPQTGAKIFAIKNAAFTIKLTGSGSLRAQQQGGAAPGGAQEAAAASEDGPRIETIQPPGYDRNFTRVFLLVGAILALVFAAMYLKGSQRKA
jgi:hypothetical protein